MRLFSSMNCQKVIFVIVLVNNFMLTQVLTSTRQSTRHIAQRAQRVTNLLSDPL